ncbi:hypothetical protein [Arenibacter certesii]|uniref:hypothetical protein n=1 Tax=Arenibacter certesii TaxID=228955 RepID=UPI0012FAF258|nr:hypothetical protein [Arenibacter certesii]
MSLERKMGMELLKRKSGRNGKMSFDSYRASERTTGFIYKTPPLKSDPHSEGETRIRQAEGSVPSCLLPNVYLEQLIMVIQGLSNCHTQLFSSLLYHQL